MRTAFITLFRYLCCSSLVCCSIYAGDTLPADSSSVKSPYDLGVIVVTGTRTKKQPATVRELNVDTLKQQGAVTVADALRDQPGITVTVGAKNETGVMIRGIRTERVLMMIDGRPVNMPYYGNVDLSSLQLDNISRIQITEGTPSLLYGVNGSAGVINIVTRRALVNEGYLISGSLSEGSVHTFRGSAEVQARKNSLYGGCTFSRNRSDGYPLSQDFRKSLLGIEDGGLRDNSDFDRTAFSAKVGYDFPGGGNTALSAGYYTDQNGIPSPTDFPQYRRFPNWQRGYADLTGRLPLGGKGDLKTKFFYDKFKNEMIEYTDRSMDSISWDSFHDHWDMGGIVTVDLPLGVHAVSAGINGRYDAASTRGYLNGPLREYAMATGSAALEGRLRPGNGPLEYTASVNASAAAARNDLVTYYRDMYDVNLMGGVRLSLGKTNAAHLSAGKYTRYPTLSQLYSDDKGNPDLEPERSFSLDMGVEYALLDWLHGRVSLFDEEFRELIMNYRLPQTPVSRYVNIAKAWSRGAECGIAFDVLKINKLLTVDYVYNPTWDFNGKKALSYVPAHKLGGQLSFPFINGGNVRIGGTWTGSRCGDSRSSLYDGYFLLNGSVAYRWKIFTASFVVNNIFDADYFTEDPAYPMPGRTLRGLLAVEFGGTFSKSPETAEERGEK